MGADPVTAGIIAAPLVGGVIGAEQARGSRRAAEAARRQAMAQFAGIELPTIEEQLYQFTPEMMPEYLGGYDPAMEEFIELGPTAMEDISLDPRLREAQMGALEQLSEIGEVGLTDAEKAAMRQIRRESAGEARAQQESILQEMARRGAAGGGQELAARLAASQAAAGRMAGEGDVLAQMAQQRALQAMSQAGQLGGQIRGQEFGEQADVARARDIISQFNVAQQQAQQARNIQAQREAQVREATERQRIAEQRAGLRRETERRRADLPGMQFGRELDLAGARAGQFGGQAAAREAEAARRAQLGTDVGTAIGSGLARYHDKD